MNDSTELPIEISVSDVKSLLDQNADFLFLDVRENEEYATAKIDAATLLPMSELQDRVGELTPSRDRRVVVHCHHGGRSLQVTQWLRSQGFDCCQNMTGGIEVWSNEIDSSVPKY